MVRRAKRDGGGWMREEKIEGRDWDRGRIGGADTRGGRERTQKVKEG